MNTTKSKSKEKNITNHFFTPENVAQDFALIIAGPVGTFAARLVISCNSWCKLSAFSISCYTWNDFYCHNCTYSDFYIKKGNQSSFLNLLCRSFNDVNTDHLF